MRSHASYMGGYGRPKPKPKPPSLAQLQDRNQRLRDENAAFAEKVRSFDDDDMSYKATIARLSGELGSLSMRAVRLNQQTDENEHDFAQFQEEIEVEIGTLRQERDAWQRRIKDFMAAAADAENELADLDEQASAGVEKRRQLQSECLSLQQECEDARVELQETRVLLRQTGGTVERMIKQKIELEWELQEQTSKHKVLRTVLEQAGHELAHQADEAHRQRESLVTASRNELEKEKSQAESFRQQAVEDERECMAIQSERKRLEAEIAAHKKELERLDNLRRDFEEETLEESYRMGKSNEVIDSSRKQYDEFSLQMDKLEEQSRTHVSKVAEMQGERTKLLLGKAQEAAAKVLKAPDRSGGGLSDQVSGGGVTGQKASPKPILPVAPAGSRLRSDQSADWKSN